MVKMVAGTFLPPGRRVDAVLVASTAVIPIEFKVGAKKFEQADYEQAWDYGLDLKNFHAPSHAAAIFPILCATEAAKSDRRWKPPHADGVRPPFCCNGQGLGTAIALALDEEKVSATIFTQDCATPQSVTKMVADTFSGPHRPGRTADLGRLAELSCPTRSTYFPLTRLRLLACRIVSPMISSPR
jgi:hypothetical protein